MAKEELLTVRIDPGLRERIRNLEKEKLENASGIVREALDEYIKKETGLNEIKKIVAEKFAAGKISFEDTVRILGYEEARKIAFFTENADKSLKEGLK